MKLFNKESPKKQTSVVSTIASRFENKPDEILQLLKLDVERDILFKLPESRID
ncbi:hypothetical protein L917_05571 [Phytophthora nicotianae]|uniref:Uncharacterized protein n=1 Tax=Phytophthora nicotianae TaxID=4792 RepID=W2LK41_PHYNI|nr:hypothetical protein L917_05571 [Phytophthora nicotianae]